MNKINIHLVKNLNCLTQALQSENTRDQYKQIYLLVFLLVFRKLKMIKYKVLPYPETAVNTERCNGF
jgi:hypothetical protein